MTGLAASDVVAGFGDHTVLHGVDLSVAPGQALGIFGLNGAGKSVTMKVLAGLVPARKGTVRLGDRDITRMEAEDRVAAGLAYAPQARQLFPNLTVEQNVRLGGYVLRRRDKARATAVAAELYERFPLLGQRRSQLAGSLSGGQRATVTVARALASDPTVLLVAEPSAGLSPVAAQDVFAMLSDLRRDGLTIVLVEQNITFGFQLVDRAAILQTGQVIYEGDADALDRERVAALLGVGTLLGKQLDASLRGTGTSRRTTKKVS
jgi:branched-chain amino acid transport system ATP-binding protein